MKLSVQEIKDRTDELATKLQEAQLQRQEVMLSIPSVILQIASEMSLAMASNQNGLLNLFLLSVLMASGFQFRMSLSQPLGSWPISCWLA